MAKTIDQLANTAVAADVAAGDFYAMQDVSAAQSKKIAASDLSGAMDALDFFSKSYGSISGTPGADAKRVQFRSGTAIQHTSFTGAAGELTYDTTSATFRAHNGAAAGGFALMRGATFATRADFVAWVAAGGVLPNGFSALAAGHVYIAQSGSTAITDIAGFVPAKPFHVEQWGVVVSTNDGTLLGAGNYATQLQAAHDYVASIGGGEILCGAGVIPWGATLYFGETAGVTFIGYGRGESANNKTAARDSALTRWEWTGGASTGIVWTSNRLDDGTKPRIRGGGMIGILLDGAELGTVGIEEYSRADAKFEISTAFWTGAAHFRQQVLASGVAVGPSDTQGGFYDIRSFDTLTGSEPQAHFVANGAVAAGSNVSRNEYRLDLQPESTAVAAHFGNFDSNTIYIGNFTTRATASGDGGKAFLHADDTLPVAVGTADGHCRGNVFVFMQANKGLVSKQTSGGSNSASDNTVLFYSQENGAPAPTIEAASTLNYVTDGGTARLSKVTGGAVQADPYDTTTDSLFGMIENGRGSFGIGTTGNMDTLADIDSVAIPAGKYRTTSAGTAGTFPTGASKNGMLEVISRYDGDQQAIIYLPNDASAAWLRVDNATAGTWSKIVFGGELNAQTGTSYTLALTDAGDTITMDNASANTLTIPTNATVALAIGTQIEVWQKGAGTTSITAAATVTLNGVGAGTGAMTAQYGRVRLLKTGTNIWMVSGDIGTVA